MCLLDLNSVYDNRISRGSISLTKSSSFSFLYADAVIFFRRSNTSKFEFYRWKTDYLCYIVVNISMHSD